MGVLVSGSFCGKGLVGVASELFSSVIFGVDLIGGGVEVLMDGMSLSGEGEVADLTGIVWGVIFDFAVGTAGLKVCFLIINLERGI